MSTADAAGSCLNGAEFDAVLLAGREKGKQSHAFRGDRPAVWAPDRLLERSDDKGGRAFSLGRDPARPDEPVDQDRAFHDPVAAEKSEVLSGGHDPRPVRM